MEESIPVAKVTRLRRRLSVEAEDAKSPSTPSTPTKKRGGRLAAKPQLELIDENAQEKIPRRTTRKSIAKEIDPVEVVLTPSRRSARIRSNTSIISDTTQGVDSPRARRVTRRNSQVGSDTETPLTPARQTRRTRKDSSSSIDKPIDSFTNQIDDIIVEEQDVNIEEENNKEKSLRKSPRLLGSKQYSKPKTFDTNDETQNNKKSDDNKDINEEGNIHSVMDNKPALTSKDNKNDVSLLDNSNNEKENLSLSSSNLLKTMNKEPKKIREFFNKSTPNLLETSKCYSKRHRTKSFTTNIGNIDNEASFLSDNEMAKKKLRNKMINIDISKSSGDGTINTYIKKQEKKRPQEEIQLNIRQENKDIVSSMSEEVKMDVKENAIENRQDNSHSVNIISTTALLEQKPSDFQISVVLESDSNSSTDRKDTYHHLNNEDQCVPVVDTKDNISCEPMDVDETIPRNISILDSPENKDPSEIITNDHTTMNISSDQRTDINKQGQENENILNIINSGKKSKRKSSMLLENEEDTNKSKSNCSWNNNLEDAEVLKENSTSVLNIINKSKRNSSNNSHLVQFNVSNRSDILSQDPIKIAKDDDMPQTMLNLTVPSDDSINKKQNRSKSKSFSETSVMHNDSQKLTKRKNSISQLENMNSLDKTDNHSKSTLILSQIKDVSLETDNLSKTPKLYKKDLVSKPIDTINTITDKNVDKNASITCLKTSTPLQQKHLKKLGLPVDTSNISLKDNEKAENSENYTKKGKSVKNSFDKTSDDDDRCDNEVESSTDSSNLLADEAEEASDDYESGDSRDDDEREYEKDNEILEKGETLESEEEFSDDTDYEKDSFIVSSDEEDNELLSGSGDDLSMSDNELTMSKKSKNKYNDRRRKEQKKASKEMYEARHKLNESDKNMSKRKERSQQHISNLNTTDDEEPIAPIKKNKRMRIDSSHDTNNIESGMNTSENKKKKQKRRSDQSLCNDSALNEKEITICESNVVKNDPLLIDVKKEPNTPQQGLDISAVNICTMQNVEEVEIDENISFNEENETADPLQATTVAVNSDDSSLSDNPVIMQSYDTLLHNLNKTKSKKVKDISLNLNKKSKKNTKAPIFDELNLTQIEDKMNKKVNTTEPFNISKTKDKFTQGIAADTESSSNSIDMKLIFPEDSNDSEVNAATFKTTKNNSNIPKDFIPLKVSHGATNISVHKGTETDNNSNVEASKIKKNKNRKSSEEISPETVTDTKESESLFFIDTKGTLGDDIETTNTSKNSKKKKHEKNTTIDVPVEILHVNDSFKKKSNLSLPIETINYTENGDLSNDAPLEVSFTKKKKTKQSPADSKPELEEVESTDIVNEISHKEQSQSPTKKKKSKHALDIEEKNSEQHNVVDEVEEVPIEDQPERSKKKKKTKRGLDIQENNTEQQQNLDVAEAGVLEAVSIEDQSERKKKKKKSKHALEIQENNSEQQQIIEVDSARIVEEVSIEDQSEKTKKKKKSKHVLEVQENNTKEHQMAEEQMTINNEHIGSNSKKRKRKSSANITELATLEGSAEAVEASTALDEKLETFNKKKKRKVINANEESQTKNTVVTYETSEESEMKVAKNKKSNMIQENLGKLDLEPVDTVRTKKRKARDNDDTAHRAKVQKQKSNDKIHVPRLPENIINQLSEKPKPRVEKKKYAIATTSFVIEDVGKRPTKPSNYLEESVYLNESPKLKKQQYPFKHVKVLPFLPTATTSYKGFTTDFKVKVLEENTPFIAQAAPSHNFKKDVLQNNRMKKLGTLEKYKKFRNEKIWKF